MHKIPEDIIIIIFRYLHHDKMIKLNIEYHELFQLYQVDKNWDLLVYYPLGLNTRDLCNISSDAISNFKYDEVVARLPKNY